jgi:phospholipid-binding lipoprotein MlaA
MSDNGNRRFWRHTWSENAFLLGFVLGLGACAGDLPEVELGPVPDIAKGISKEGAEIHDPWEKMNRGTFWFNLQVDKYFLRPVAVGYKFVLPGQVQNSVGNMLDNASSPVTFANDLLQGEFKRSGVTLGRLFANSTAGIGGLFDVAGRIGLPKHTSDFGQTLAVWGAGEGPYLMLPLLGPSNLRDSIGGTVDVFFDPLTYVYFFNDIEYGSAAQRTLSATNFRAVNMEQIDELQATSIDFYATVRSAYQQARQKHIYGDSTVNADFNEDAFDEFE